MPDRTMLAADRLWVCLEGAGTLPLLGRAAAQGIRLRRAAGGSERVTLCLEGRDLPRLKALAAESGVALTLLRRKGGGRALAGLWRRPGLWLGTALFALLVWWGGGYVWTIDFTALDADTALTVRTVLAQHGIREGSRPDAETLRAAETALAARPELFGWVAVNFGAGRLTVEATPRRQQSIRTATAETALYARDDAEVLAVRVESGFAAAAPGQYVAKGQLLANAQRADREGEPVPQSASGSVIGRVKKQFAASQPLTEKRLVPTGRRTVRRTLFLLGREIPLDGGSAVSADAQRQENWQPLQIGGLALPGCLCIQTDWERTQRQISHTPEAARALAQRSCRLQLLAQYPDAVIEQQNMTCREQDGAVHCSAEFVFQTDIAVPGRMQPLDGGTPDDAG